MRNLKKFLALVLAMLMVVSAAATVSAFEDVAEDAVFAEAIAKLNEHGIVQGTGNDEEGNPVFGYDEKVTRLQAAIFFARALTGEVDPTNEYWRQGPAQFPDVTDFQYAVTVAVNRGIINGVGNPDGTITFNPQNSIKYVEALKMAVCALGLGEGVEWGVDGLAFYNVADAYGLTKNVNYITDLAQELTRGEFAQIIYNMISAEYVDNGELTTLLKKVFDDPKDPEPEVIIPAEELTTFVVTATKKQYATENIGVTDGGYVGLQQLVDGIPTGDVLYVKLADMGVASDDEAEALFAKAFDLVNYNAEDDSFDRIDAHDSEVTYIYNKDLSVSGDKFTYNSKLYYPVDELTGSAIRNEMVIYNREGDDLFKYEHVDNKLVLNRWGELYFGDTNLKASDFAVAIDADTLVLEEYEDRDGNIYYLDYYYKKDANGKYINESGFIDEDKAAEKYGIPVDSYYETSLEFLGTSALTGAYVLVAYNDDPVTSDTIDRAYFHKVWLSAYEATLASGNKAQFGAMKGDANVKYVDIDGNAVTLNDGDVFTYIYNYQTNTATVLEVATTGKDTIRRISTINDKKDGNYAVVITLENDGTFTLANDNRNALQGYAMHANGVLDTLTSIAGIANGSKVGGIAYTYDVNFDDLDSRDYIEYVKLGDQIIFAAEIDQSAGYKLMILEETLDFDFEAITADMWRVGEKDHKEVALTNILYGDKYVELASANTPKQLRIWNQMFEAKPGTVYRAYDIENGVKLGEEFAYASTKYTKAQTNDTSVIANDFGLAYMVNADNTVVDFDKNGIGASNTNDDYNAIRTDDNTVFYFICVAEGNEKIEIFPGKPSQYASINDDADVYIYADKLGWSESYMDGKTATTLKNDVAGIASKVLVFYTDKKDIANFSIYNADERVIYVSEASINDYLYNGKTGTYLDPWEYGTGKELGMPKEYWDGDYVCYDATIAIDMHDGTLLSDIYALDDPDLKLEKGGFFMMNDDGVITAKADSRLIEAIQLNTADVTTYRGANYLEGVKKTAIKLMKYDAVVHKDNVTTKAGLSADYDSTVYTLANDDLDANDATFVGIVAGPVLTVTVTGAPAGEDVVVDLEAIAPVTIHNNTYYYNNIDVDNINATVEAIEGYTATVTETSKTNTLAIAFTKNENPVIVNDGKFFIRDANKNVVADTEGSVTLSADFDADSLIGSIKVNGFDDTKAPKTTAVKVNIKKYNDDAAEFKPFKSTTDTAVTGSYANGVLTVEKILKAGTSSVNFGLDAGEYLVTFVIGTGDYTNERVMEFELIVD